MIPSPPCRRPMQRAKPSWRAQLRRWALWLLDRWLPADPRSPRR